MKEFGMIRHGEKLAVGEKRKSIEESGLTTAEQRKWKETVERLKLEDPEISYAALPKIEALARDIYDKLPNEALVVFVSTKLPRARMTADLLASEISQLTLSGEKKIGTAFFWEPDEVAAEPDSVSNISMYPPEVVEAFQKFAEQNTKDDQSLKEYFGGDENSPGNLFHPDEDKWVFNITNQDLESDDSYLRRRAELLKKQFAKVTEAFKDNPEPVYFFGVGHHQSLIALDVAFNRRTKYNSVDEMPKPLSLWKANLSKNE